MTPMSHRERVLKALNHEETDRVPLDVGSSSTTGINLHAYENLKKHLGLDIKPKVLSNRSQLAWVDERILHLFDIDTRILAPPPMEDKLTPATTTNDGLESYTDEWGIVRTKPVGGHYYVSKVPFEGSHVSVLELKKHKWPDPTDPNKIKGLKEEAQRLRQQTDYALVLNLPGRLISLGQSLRGFGPWLEDLVINQKFACGLLDIGLEIQMELCKRMLEAVGDCVDVVHFGDDYGMQTGPILSPDLYRNIFKPRQKKLYSLIKAKTDAKILYHSCGSVYKLIGDFIDAGIDALNPIQVSAEDMDTKKLKREFGNKIAFWGGVDSQRVLPFGTRDGVRKEVKGRIDDLGPGGGYILAAVHNIQAEVPPENIVALFETGKEYVSRRFFDSR
jgi:uroporphyrinogen decarboxylase